MRTADVDALNGSPTRIGQSEEATRGLMANRAILEEKRAFAIALGHGN